MNHPDSPDRHDATAVRLEHHISELLREQPLQRAPAALMQRVLAAIEQRQRSAFQRWPLAMRIAFVVLAGMTAHLNITLVRLIGDSITTPRPPWVVVLAETALDTLRHFPSIWSQLAVSALILIYGGMFGLGLAVYRTVNPRH
jgi:hypothetical protein